MHELPVMLRLGGRKVVVVGGGAVALRRTRSLLEAGALVTVIAPRMVGDFAALEVKREQRPYAGGDLRGAVLVVIATDDTAVNALVSEEAARSGVLRNRADEPELGDVVIPAHARIGPVTVAVGSGGISPGAAAKMRDEMLLDLDRDWVVLLEAIERIRGELAASVGDIARRRAAMHKLTGPEAMALLKEKGVEALRQRAAAVLEEARRGESPVVADNEDG